MASTEVDVLIVGLGPAGACAAATAAEASLNVLAIERNAEPGLPVQCAEFVPLMMGYSGIPTKMFSVQSIDCMNTFLTGNSQVTTTENFNGHMIDRASMDQHLIQRAMDLGATCRFSSPLRGFDPSGNAVLNNGETIVAKSVVGADGPRSICGKAIGREIEQLVMTRQITVDLHVPHKGTDIFLHENYLGGYGWLFPKGSQCHIGLGLVPELKDQLKPLLGGLHNSLIEEGRVGREIHNHTGGLIPVSGPVSPTGVLGTTAFFLAGDAAGLSNPVTGAGINAAIISGQLAGEAAAETCLGVADAMESYQDEIDAIFGSSLSHAARKREEQMAEFHKTKAMTQTSMKRGWVAFPEFWERQNNNTILENIDGLRMRESA